MECYVTYFDSENGFKKSTKDFKTYADAWEWITKTFDKPSRDFIYYY